MSEKDEIITKLYAGYQQGCYYIKLDADSKIGTIAEFSALGYKLQFVEPPFGKPIMLKKRD